MNSIRYIWHDCYVVELSSATLIFDYWKDPLHCLDISSLRPELPLFILVSHGHKDHFNPEIFRWAQIHPDVHFIVSKDVWMRSRHVASPTSVYKGPHISPDRLIPLKPGESISFPQKDGCKITVKAFPSTDIGNSYLVGCDDKRIFHAGDLNDWIWDDDTPAEAEAMQTAFNQALDDIRAWMESHPRPNALEIDIAFFPIDGRLGGDYARGARQFCRQFSIGTFLPMHFALDKA